MSGHDPEPSSQKLSRRTFLKWSAAAATLPLLADLAETSAAGAHELSRISSGTAGAVNDLEEVTIAELQAAMAAGSLSARQLVLRYVQRIQTLDQSGPQLRSLLEVNPDVLALADELDAERKAKGPRSPLHGIPILLKDNIDTADTMLTTAGSLALVGSKPRQDAFVAQRLREAGAILLGKTNLSEWANFRSTRSSSGWSGRGRQNLNPYALDRNPCGSSSGSAAAVSANFAAAALGTETDGSIVCPSSACGVVGIKPTVGLVSRAGVIPIAHSQDTVGPHGRTVADAAAVLGALTGVDPRDPATQASVGKSYSDYTQFLDPNGLKGARIGVPRQGLFGWSQDADRITNAALGIMQAMGAVIVDPADIPSISDIASSPVEFEVLLYEFKADLNLYLATRDPNPRYPNSPVMRTLADLIEFNRATAAVEMPYFGQEIFEMAQAKGPLSDPDYLKALETSHRLSRQEGLDAVLDKYQLDALVAPTGSPAWPIDLINGDHFLGGSSSPAAMAGYPLVTVPAGYVAGLPVGITFMGRAFSEPTLIRLAYAFEQATKFRRAPQFRPSIGLQRRSKVPSTTTKRRFHARKKSK
ncbi:MAG TPA: amidase [Herpetosiphonaceae bacterium]